MASYDRPTSHLRVAELAPCDPVGLRRALESKKSSPRSPRNVRQVRGRGELPVAVRGHANGTFVKPKPPNPPPLMSTQRGLVGASPSRLDPPRAQRSSSRLLQPIRRFRTPFNRDVGAESVSSSGTLSKTYHPTLLATYSRCGGSSTSALAPAPAPASASASASSSSSSTLRQWLKRSERRLASVKAGTASLRELVHDGSHEGPFPPSSKGAQPQTSLANREVLGPRKDGVDRGCSVQKGLSSGRQSNGESGGKPNQNRSSEPPPGICLSPSLSLALPPSTRVPLATGTGGATSSRRSLASLYGVYSSGPAGDGPTLAYPLKEDGPTESLRHPCPPAAPHSSSARESPKRRAKGLRWKPGRSPIGSSSHPASAVPPGGSPDASWPGHVEDGKLQQHGSSLDGFRAEGVMFPSPTSPPRVPVALSSIDEVEAGAEAEAEAEAETDGEAKSESNPPFGLQLESLPRPPSEAHDTRPTSSRPSTRSTSVSRRPPYCLPDCSDPLVSRVVYPDLAVIRASYSTSLRFAATAFASVDAGGVMSDDELRVKLGLPRGPQNSAGAGARVHGGSPFGDRAAAASNSSKPLVKASSHGTGPVYLPFTDRRSADPPVHWATIEEVSQPVAKHALLNKVANRFWAHQASAHGKHRRGTVGEVSHSPLQALLAPGTLSPVHGFTALRWQRFKSSVDASPASPRQTGKSAWATLRSRAPRALHLEMSAGFGATSTLSPVAISPIPGSPSKLSSMFGAANAPRPNRKPVSSRRGDEVGQPAFSPTAEDLERLFPGIKGVDPESLNPGDSFEVTAAHLDDQLRQRLELLDAERSETFRYKYEAFSRYFPHIGPTENGLKSLATIRLEAETARMLHLQHKYKCSKWYRRLLECMVRRHHADRSHVSAAEREFVERLKEVLVAHTSLSEDIFKNLVFSVEEPFFSSGAFQRMFAFLRRVLDVDIETFTEWHKEAGFPPPIEQVFSDRLQARRRRARDRGSSGRTHRPAAT